MRRRSTILSLALAVFMLALAATAQARTITWSGWTWTVRHSAALEGPGPNQFDDSTQSVFVDKQGRLHLRVRYDSTLHMWVSSEIFSEQWFSGGKFTWVVDSPGNTIDPNVTLGMYIYQDLTHEYDVELSKWGNPNNPNNADYAVQPWSYTNGVTYFNQPAGTDTFSLNWQPNSVTMSGSGPRGWRNSWANTGPYATGGWYAPAHINLWQYHGAPPASGRTVEVVFRSFTYTPPA